LSEARENQYARRRQKYSSVWEDISEAGQKNTVFSTVDVPAVMAVARGEVLGVK